MSRGGKREGAGRPRVTEQRVRLTVRVNQETKEYFRRKAISAGRLLDEIAKGQSK